MPTFVHPALLWGLPIVGVPVLIHLINMLRHRRVDWAAMEFLLLSQKKNRTWILLKQLLLLLMRMAAVAIIVLMVAQPLLRSRLGDLFGGSKTHHIVLLDDSFSMSDRWADTSAMAEAKAVIERLGAKAADERLPQKFTLLRFSQAGRVARGTQPDMLEELVDQDFVERLRDTLKPLDASETAAGPIQALEAIGQLLGSGDDEHRIVYLVSDFRAGQWDDPTDLRKHLEHLNTVGAKIQLINCVEASRPNLAVVSLTPAAGTRAAGVPLFMEVGVRNFGTAPAREVPVLLEEDGHPRPAVKISEIPPGQTVKERFLVHFPTAGQHQITARLESDAVAADNFRYDVVDLPVGVPVLLVDGDAEAFDARFLSVALAPGGATKTGITPQIETPRYLSLNSLDGFHTIYLANVDRIEESAIESLEQYVKDGGGVGVFLGERCRSKFFNDELYRDGQGIFPLPLAGQAELLVDRLEKAPDLEVTDHPIFRIFSGQRNSFIATVNVNRYFAAPNGWKPKADSTVRVIARLRNGAPLAVEKRFGEGRVLAFLTTAAPIWNNWARNNPSFVVAIQEMQAYLARSPSADVVHQVGSTLELELDPGEYQTQVRFTTPDQGAAPATADAVPGPDGSLAVRLPETDIGGIYEARLTKTDGAAEVRRYAFNVDPQEGDLKSLDGPRLAVRLPGVEYQYDQSSAFQYSGHELAGYNLGEALLYLLILLLIGEQILAWSASYHPPTRLAARAKGGVR